MPLGLERHGPVIIGAEPFKGRARKTRPEGTPKNPSSSWALGSIARFRHLVSRRIDLRFKGLLAPRKRPKYWFSVRPTRSAALTSCERLLPTLCASKAFDPTATWRQPDPNMAPTRHRCRISGIAGHHRLSLFNGLDVRKHSMELPSRPLLRSRAKRGVSKDGPGAPTRLRAGPSFETRCCASLLRMRPWRWRRRSLGSPWELHSKESISALYFNIH